MIFYIYNFDYRLNVNNQVPVYLPDPPNLVRLKVDFGCEIPKCLGKYKFNIKTNKYEKTNEDADGQMSTNDLLEK